MVRITRRDFLKYSAISAGALGLSASTLMKLDKAIAKETVDGGIPVVWLDGAACTGCSMSLLNTVFYTTIDELLIDTLDLNFHKTIMTACGSPDSPVPDALTAAQDAYSGADNPTGVPLYVLVVEGGVQCAAPPPALANNIGDYCKNGQLTTVSGAENMLANTQLLASHALAVLSVGACASWGGIPGARGSATDARGTLYKQTTYGKGALLDSSVAYTTNAVFSNAVNTSYAFTKTTPLTNILGMPIQNVTVNISGCPPHPDWIVGTIASIVSTLPPITTIVNLVLELLGGSTTALSTLQSTLSQSLPSLTSFKRPLDTGYKEYQCNAGPCQWRFNNTPNRASNSGSSTPFLDVYGTNAPPPNAYTLYSAEPDYNVRYPIGDSRALGRAKWGQDGGNSTLGCLGILGCKGRKTKADCSRRRWNAINAEYGVNWCVGSRGNCQGCTEPTFPDRVGKFYTFS